MRWMFRVVAGISLMLCAALVGLRVRAVWVNDIVGCGGPAGSWSVQSWHWRLMVSTSNVPSDSRLSWYPRWVTPGDEDSPAFMHTGWNRAGFVYLDVRSPPMPDVWPRPGVAMVHDRYLGMPTLVVAGVFGVLPGVWAWRWWRRRGRVEKGLCAGCGYDLRATVGRCPECGRTVGGSGAVQGDGGVIV
jgi:hypothetical protein